MRKLELHKKNQELKRQAVVKKVQETIKSEVEIKYPDLEELKKTIDSLHEYLNSKEEYDYDKLAIKLQEISGKLDLEPYFNKIAPKDTVSVKDFNKLLQAVRDNKAQSLQPIRSIAGLATSGTTLIVSGRVRVFAFSVSTNTTTPLTLKFLSGLQEVWSIILQSPKDISTGANLAVDPPAYLFGSDRELSISLSIPVDVRWAVSYYEV